MSHFIRPAYCLVLFFIVMASSVPITVVAEDIDDPLEPVNRGVFWFNDQFDTYLFEPVAKGYDYVTPTVVKTGVGNFFRNLNYPSYLLSDLVQLKGLQAVEHTGRFVINSTLGILGLIDVASYFGIEHHEEDFGIALAYHDIPPGPYLVLPILGPSNVRDAVGRVVDTLVDPLNIDFYVDTSRDVDIGLYSGLGLRAIHERAGLIKTVETAKEASLDYYRFAQSAYYQYRRGLLYDGNPPPQDEDLYNYDDETPGAETENGVTTDTAIDSQSDGKGINQ